MKPESVLGLMNNTQGIPWLSSHQDLSDNASETWGSHQYHMQVKHLLSLLKDSLGTEMK